jgi:DNA-binding XRE family transcriptional regulator
MNYRTPLEKAVMKSGLKKGYIAERIGVRPTTVSQLIAGKSRPDILTALKLARLLNKTVEELWGHLIEEEENRPE